MANYDILRRIFVESGFTSYLEIGVAQGTCFREIPAEIKVGVDPWPLTDLPGILTMTSDDFFASNDEFFDLCFVDGYHSMAQALRDTINAVKISKTIVLDDTMPPHRETATPKPTEGGWHGEVWKVCEYFRRTGVQYVTIDSGFGLTVLQQQPILFEAETFAAVENLDWDFYEQNKESILNPVSPSDFWLL